MNASLFAHLTTIVVNSFILLALGIGILFALRRESASLRHQIILAVFAALIALPVLNMALPTWNLALFPDPWSRNSEPELVVNLPGQIDGSDFSPDQLSESANSLNSGTGGPSLPANAGTDVSDGTQSSTGFSVQRVLTDNALTMILVIWGIGALVVLVLQLVRWAGAGFIAEMSESTGDSRLEQIKQELCTQMGISRPVLLLKSGISAVTMTWGIRKPCVVMPAEAEAWTGEEAEAVLRHELAHIMRNDNLIQMIAVFVGAIYWFNPLVWRILQRLHIEREMACDDYVLNSGTSAATYARYLMNVSIKLNGPKSRTIIPAVMAHSSNVKKRLLSILNPSANRRHRGVVSALLCAVLVSGAVVPLAAFRPWAETAVAGNGSYTMQGSIKANKYEVEISDLTLSSASGEFEAEADDVILDPESRDGYDFTSDQGYLIIRTGRKGAELEFKAVPDDSRSKLTMLRRGEEREVTRVRERQFRELVDELFDILTPSDRSSVPLARIYEPALGYSDFAVVAPNASAALAATGLGKSGSYSTSGRSSDVDDGIKLDDVFLESSSGDFEAEIDNVILNPDDSLGFHFGNGEGYLFLVADDEDGHREYRFEKSRHGRDYETEQSCFVDGRQAEFDEERLQEVEELMERLWKVYGPMHHYGSSEDTGAGIGLTTIVREDKPPIIISDIDDDMLIYDAEREHYVQALNTRQSSAHNYQIVELMESISARLDELIKYHTDNISDDVAREALTEVYSSRDRRVSRTIDRTTRDLFRDPDIGVALDGIDELFDEYLNAAQEALESVPDQESKKSLSAALVGFYEDVEKYANQQLDRLDRRSYVTELRSDKEEIYSAILNHVSEAVESIGER